MINRFRFVNPGSSCPALGKLSAQKRITFSATRASRPRPKSSRLAKSRPTQDHTPLFAFEGDPNAPIALVTWGSMIGVAREALRLARAEGLRVKLLAPSLLYPVIEPVYADFFASVKRGLFVEQSFQGQLYRMVRMYVDLPAGVEAFAKSGPGALLPLELLEQIREMDAALRQPPRRFFNRPRGR